MPSEIVLAAELLNSDGFGVPSHARIFLNRHTVRFIRDARAAWKAAEAAMPDAERRNVWRLDLYFPFAVEAGEYDDRDFVDLEPEAAGATFEEDEEFAFYPHLLVDGDDFFFRLLGKHGDDEPETDLIPWAYFEDLAAGLDATTHGEAD